MKKGKRLHAKIVSASKNAIVIEVEHPSKAPKVGDNLVVTIPSEAKVEMIHSFHCLPKVMDTIARGKVIGVTEDVVTVEPMTSRTNVAKLQSLASTKTSVGVNAIENRIRVH